MNLRLIIAVVSFLVLLGPVRAQDKDEGAKVLERWVGMWKNEQKEKAAKFTPEAREIVSMEVVTPILKNRFLLGKGQTRSSNQKSLWLMTYDPKTRTYPFWFFASGVFGGEWSGTWDEAKKTLTSRATDTPMGWTSSGVTRFVDGQPALATAWMKDENGALMFEFEATKNRMPDKGRDVVLADWSRILMTKTPPPEQMKNLEPMVGRWESTANFKAPKETKTTRVVTGQFVLDSFFVETTSVASDGQEAYTLWTYDPNAKKYRYWWFSSDGQSRKLQGDWNAATRTLSFESEPVEGRTLRSTLRFTEKNRHEWQVHVKDGNDRVYFQVEGTATRKQE